jgi:hypothetical protein
MNRKAWMLIALGMFTLACSLPYLSPNKQNPPASGGGAAPTAGANQSPLLPFTATATSIPSSPIGLRQGLSSLNSYRLEIRAANNGPTAQDVNEMNFLVESGTDGKSWHITNSSKSSSADSPDLSTSQDDQYKVGEVMCQVSGSDSEAKKSDVDPQVQEVMDAWYGLIDLVPMVKDPVYLGSESVNGGPANHFSFKVGGLGVTSGAEVVASDGEYWLAVDGQYILKYIVHLETRSGPAGDANTKTLRSEFSIEVKDINQPIVITIPPGCK